MRGPPMRYLLLTLLFSGCRAFLEPDKPGQIGVGDKDPGVETDPPIVETDDVPRDTSPDEVDRDGDGYGPESDCDDEDASVNPESEERPYNGVDDDCDPLTPDDDLDLDGFMLAVDCDDNDASQNPRMVEVPYTGIDEDCDATTPDDDLDADGALGVADCDDLDPDRYPGATETCDGTDEDCDGQIDDAAGASWHLDLDGDGWGDPFATAASCTPGLGLVVDGSDCDDSRPDVYPGAVEWCDDTDNDCDVTIDEDAVDATTWHADADQDGFGDPADGPVACEAPPGATADATDCDDAAQAVFPGAVELCNGVDDDCDGQIDEDAADAGVWFSDRDGDGWGDVGSLLTACAQPPDASAQPGDCDDRRSDVSPGAAEVCGGVDEDCDGLVDEPGATGGSVWYADIDGDRYGDPDAPVDACVAPPATVRDDTDCDDAIPSVFPGAVELCDGLDNDCDGVIDDGVVDDGTFYGDGDGDGWGDATDALVTCTPPPGAVADDGDCDDADPAVRPGAPEVCDGRDQDCDGVADDGAVDPTVWYADADADRFGDLGSARAACAAPPGFVGVAGDCNDLNPAVNPDAPEICDGLDNDCVGGVDAPDPVGGSTWYLDLDGDSVGGEAITACSLPIGAVSVGGDCDDRDRTIFPGAPEVCDGVDEDCDGAIDDGAAQASFYLDGDGDGWGSGPAARACVAPPGHVAVPGDCDDAAVDIRPGADELCDGVDQDCDGAIDDAAIDEGTWFYDGDGDGAGGPLTQQSCAPPAGWLADGGDCDDGDRGVYPDAAEVCDGVDQDCDGAIDDDVVGAPFWYADGDSDGWGGAVGGQACAPPLGGVLRPGDCDDGDAAVSPGDAEVCNGVDDDCDGVADDGAPVGALSWYPDGDGDGFGVAGPVVNACVAPPNHAANGLDCDDLDRTVFPGAVELCDGEDDDCDTQIDEGAVGLATWYTDGDGDGWGTGVAVLSCAAPPGTVESPGDCDDGDPSVSPGATERCNDADDDCDAQIDELPLADGAVWLRDGDRDGFGDPGTTLVACDAPAGFVAVGGDCDDGDRAVSPAGTETCDGADEDCDGVIDDGAIGPTWFVDGDGDGFGGDTTVRACVAPPDTVGRTGDCVDADAAIFPGAPERCNGADDDCDLLVDEGAALDGDPWYPDGDRDGFGAQVPPTLACAQPPGFVADTTDCDDGDATSRPGGTERCDGEDDDCDGQIDEGAVDRGSWYVDGDGDGWGAGVATLACEPPPGMVPQRGDCDDGRAAAFPSAPEVCNGLDEDCDGRADDNAVDADVWYLDADLDTFGTPAVTTASCTQPAGYVADDNDCNDLNAQDRPGGVERCDGRDNDCDGAADEAGAQGETRWYLDGDGDGWGDGGSTLACAAPPGFGPIGDCDDADVFTFPGADERCNGNDDDCDGRVDEGAVDPGTWFLDVDGDGFGDAIRPLVVCVPPVGYVADGTDCEDRDDAIFPGATELCNGVDDNCDGEVDFAGAPDARTWYRDEDCDGQGDVSTGLRACFSPGAGWVDDSRDCDDSDPRTRSGGVEQCDGEDDDCDGLIDTGCVTLVQIGAPSEPSPGAVAEPGACGRFGEVNSGMNVHDIRNMESFQAILDGRSPGRVAVTEVEVDRLDWSTRCGTNMTASIGNFSPTTPWPSLGNGGNAGVARYRGYLHIGCGEPTERTVGLIGNDAVRLLIEGQTVLEQDWTSGRWKKFRWVSFPGPGLYAFEIQWDTNFVCDIDPLEVVWSDTLLPGYQSFDTMCASSNCGVYGNGVAIPGFRVIDGDELARGADGGPATCALCSSNADCVGGSTCNSAGICE